MEREAMAELTRVESVVEAWLSDFRNLVLDMLERSPVHRSASRRWPRPHGVTNAAYGYSVP